MHIPCPYAWQPWCLELRLPKARRGLALLSVAIWILCCCLYTVLPQPGVREQG